MNRILSPDSEVANTVNGTVPPQDLWIQASVAPTPVLASDTNVQDCACALCPTIQLMDYPSEIRQGGRGASKRRAVQGGSVTRFSQDYKFVTRPQTSGPSVLQTLVRTLV